MSPAKRYTVIFFAIVVPLYGACGGGGDVTAPQTPATPQTPASAKVAKVTVAPAMSTIAIGSAQQLSVTLTDATGNTLSGRTAAWTSSDSLQAKVSNGGLVSGLVVGTDTITASSEGVSGISIVTIKPVATLIGINRTIDIGQKIFVGHLVVYKDASGNIIDTAYSNPQIPDTTVAKFVDTAASVSTPGYLLALASGSVQVTGKYAGLTATATIQVRPVQFASLGSSCAVTTSGKTYCWGSSDNIGSLDDVMTVDSVHNVGLGYALRPVFAAEVPIFAAVTKTFGSGCGISPIGVAYCWGQGEAGLFGDEVESHHHCVISILSFGACTEVALPLSANAIFQTIEVGYRIDRNAWACSLTTAATVYCWGANDVGQLGTATSQTCTTNYSDVGPVSRPCSSKPLIVGNGQRFKSVAIGHDNTCAVGADSLAYCWGLRYWENGSSTTETCQPEPIRNPSLLVTCSHAPKVLAGALRFSKMTAGFYPCAISVDGLVYCWHGSPPPDALSTTLRFVDISGDGLLGCGVTVAGDGYCWGDNSLGQLGSGTVGGNAPPTLVAGAHKWSHIAVEFDGRVCGLTTASDLYCWGGGWYVGDVSPMIPGDKAHPLPVRMPDR